MRSRNLVTDLRVSLICHYGSIRRAAQDLDIPENRLYEVFRKGSCDGLRWGDMKKLAPLLRGDIRNEIMVQYLP